MTAAWTILLLPTVYDPKKASFTLCCAGYDSNPELRKQECKTKGNFILNVREQNELLVLGLAETWS